MTSRQESVEHFGERLMPVTAVAPSNKQRLFILYFTAILIDLVVLNLFEEYWANVTIDSFTISLLVAALLQVLLKLTIAVKQRIGNFFKGRPGGLMKFLRFFFAWLVLFGSKFVILEAISLFFGDTVSFDGAYYGLITIMIVILAMLAAEEAVARLYRHLSDSPRSA